MRAGFFEAPVVGEGGPVAPGLFVGFSGRFDGGGCVARVSFDLSEHVQGVGVEQGIWAALGRFPHIVQHGAGGFGIALATAQFGQCDEGLEFFFCEVYCASAGQGVVEFVVRQGVVAQG
jgi:hypothetical protein